MTLHELNDSALARAVRAVGTQTAFGVLIGKRQSVINDWLRQDKELPAEYVFTVEAATGISRHDLRPDIYPREEGPAAPAAGNDALAGETP